MEKKEVEKERRRSEQRDEDVEKDSESGRRRNGADGDAGKGSGCLKEKDIRGRTSDWLKMTEGDDVMSDGGGGSESQSRIVHPQHVLYELFEFRAFRGRRRCSFVVVFFIKMGDK